MIKEEFLSFDQACRRWRPASLLLQFLMLPHSCLGLRDAPARQENRSAPADRQQLHAPLQAIGEAQQTRVLHVCPWLSEPVAACAPGAATARSGSVLGQQHADGAEIDTVLELQFGPVRRFGLFEAPADIRLAYRPCLRAAVVVQTFDKLAESHRGAGVLSRRLVV
jgi:hypothetical protein